MYSFSYLEPVCYSMSTSNCCFLTCIKVSQETDQVVCYSHLFQNFPQFIVIHTVKGFGIVSIAEIDVFLELSCFFDDPADVGNSISHISAFSKTSLNIWKFRAHILLKPGLENLSIPLLACEMSAIVCQFEHSLALPFFGMQKLGNYKNNIKNTSKSIFKNRITEGKYWGNRLISYTQVQVTDD